jgi:hypothetical protein
MVNEHWGYFSLLLYNLNVFLLVNFSTKAYQSSNKVRWICSLWAQRCYRLVTVRELELNTTGTYRICALSPVADAWDKFHSRFAYVCTKSCQQLSNSAKPCFSEANSCWHVHIHWSTFYGTWMLFTVFTETTTELYLNRNRPWRPIGLWDVKDPTLSRQ